MRTKRKNIEDSYRLSPVQQGMLFHSLNTRQSGVYHVQFICAFHEDLNVSAFKKAWQRVAERHPILRTSFRWEGLKEPLQDVHTHVTLPFEEQDWRDLPMEEQKGRLLSYLKTDRCRSFELTEPPLVRFALFRVGQADYRFIWTLHHALLDGRSAYLLWVDIFAFYKAFSQNQDLPLKHPPPYRDYINWLQEQDLTEAETFWRRMLKGFTAPTPLVVDRVHGDKSVEKGDYREKGIRLSETMTTSLRSLAERHELTLNTLVQGAWVLLLSRYSGEEDVIFGATRACRHSALEGAESMVGILLNTLPMRASLSPEKSLLLLLKELRAQWMALREYEHTPLPRIMEWSDIPAGKPLFESLVVFENFTFHSILQAEGGGWENREVRFTGQTNYPLVLAGYSEPELLLEIGYDRHDFDDATIARMLGHLQTLLEGIVANPQQRLSELSLLTEAERHQLLLAWNDTQREYAEKKCIHQLFEDQVDQTPDAIALVFEDEQLTYRELNSQANQLAHYLEKLGVGPEVLVGICVERSVEMMVGLLGILKAGGAYVPFDPWYPKERLAFMLEDTQAPVLLTQQRLADRFSKEGTRVVCLDADREIIALQSARTPVTDVTANNMAYVLYTSGSTGRPKGVGIEHHSTVVMLNWAREVFAPEDFASVLLSTSICFDLSIFEQFVPLSWGGKVILVKNALHLRTLPAANDVTLINTVPSTIAELVRADSIPASVHTVNLAGEPLQKYLVQQIYQQNTIQQVFNLYGPSEDTTYSTFALVRGEVVGSPPIGRPIANTQVYILDRHLQSVPIGILGELYLGGAGLSRGYLNYPEMTAEQFIPNPFSAELGARLYKTGDLARYLPDGNIEFIGRLDYQVKVRGFRIELGEIETVLVGHPAVRETVVMAREDQPGDKRLVAYVVPQQQQTPTVNELSGFLRKKLPDYMVPSAFMMLQALPLTPNKKVDRQRLPAPERIRPELEKDFVAPRSPVEEVLARIWAQVLGVERVGIHDNFFELGGHSLLTMQVVSHIREVFKVELPLSSVFEAPTIAGFAQVNGDILQAKSAAALDTITSREDFEKLEL
jgi:amino acid adenylation domain-containing protein